MYYGSENLKEIINEITLKLNAELKDFCTIHIGGKAKFLFCVYDNFQLYKVCIWCRTHHIKYKVIGLGANLIFDDLGYDGAIIVNKTGKISFKKNAIFVDAGMPVSKLIYTALDHNLSGLEHLAGIPATVGGAIFNNLGAFDCSFADHVEYVTAIDSKKLQQKLYKNLQTKNAQLKNEFNFLFDSEQAKNTKINNELYNQNFKKVEKNNDKPHSKISTQNFTFQALDKTDVDQIIDEINAIDLCHFKSCVTKINKEDCTFGYRTSMFKNCAGRYIILGCKLVLKNADINFIQQEIAATIQKKIESQPLDYPSAGSVFKRIYFDEYLIDTNELENYNPYTKNIKRQTKNVKDKEIMQNYNNTPNILFPAKIIDELGLKGLSVGGAQISKKHAGFIINTGDATQKDFVLLTNQIKSAIFARYNLSPQFEVEFVPF